MNIFLICVCVAAGLAISLVLIFACLPKKMKTGIKVFSGIIAVFVCVILSGVFGFCLSLKSNTSAVINQSFDMVCTQVSDIYPGVIDEQFSIDELVVILEKVNISAQIDAATDGLGSTEKFIVNRLIYSFFPVVYSVDAVSGTLQGLITDEMRASGTASLAQLFDVIEMKITDTVQKTVSVILIVVSILFVIFVIAFIVVARVSVPAEGRQSKAITFGDGVEQ